MAEWRPCRLAGPASTTYRFCNTGKRHTVRPKNCARCRIPAQLDALEKARIHCGWLLSEFQEGGKPADIVESTQAVYDLCTAALDQAKGEEAHDAT